MTERERERPRAGWWLQLILGEYSSGCVTFTHIYLPVDLCGSDRPSGGMGDVWWPPATCPSLTQGRSECVDCRRHSASIVPRIGNHKWTVNWMSSIASFSVQWETTLWETLFWILWCSAIISRPRRWNRKDLRTFGTDGQHSPFSNVDHSCCDCSPVILHRATIELTKL